MKNLTALILIFLSSSFSYSQKSNPDSLIVNTIREANIPGIAISRINDGQLSWAKYYGYSDLENKTPVSEKTIFLLSSVSKTITAAAIMQLKGEGKLELDDNINDYLDFEVKNPNFPQSNITVRHLLMHRSSIQDNYQFLMPLWENNNGDSDTDLNEFLKNYLSVEGEQYDSNTNYSPTPPGAVFNYSNIGFALIGQIIEEISGIPFEEYCQKQFFNKIEMNDSKWFLKDLNKDLVAKQYQFNPSENEFEFIGFSGFPDYPAGQLRSSLNDYSSFLITWMNQGKWKDEQIINASSIYELTPSDFMLGVGFHTWFLYNPSKEEIIYSHFGSDKGSFAFSAFNAWTKKGIVVLINSTIEDDKKKIVYRMIDNLYNDY